MARIAINAVVDVSAYTAMSRVGRCGRVARRALKDRIVAGIGVTGRTHALGITVGN